MWNVGQIPLYLWLMLLLPRAVLAVYAAARRRSGFGPIGSILSFSLAVAFASITESAYTVFVMKKFDGKFRDAPYAAVELSLFGDAVVAFIGLLLFGGTVLLLRRHMPGTFTSIGLAALFGTIYPTLPNAVYWCDVATPLVISWSWILITPVAAAFLSRDMGRGRTDGLGTCADPAPRTSFR